MVHTLSLLDASPYASGRFICNICQESGCGPVYHCTDCDFDVHVMCAATAKQQIHITHPQHLLHLSQCQTRGHTCDSCGSKIHTLSFRCNMCDFDIHPTCVRAPRYIKHRSHPHPLTLVESSSSDLLQCDGCKMPVKKFFYRCKPAGLSICDYILHQVCATLPIVVKPPKLHQHILKLLYQPLQEKTLLCGVCGQQSKGWCLHCTSCNFSLHPGCANPVHEFEQPNQDLELIAQDRSKATSSSTKLVMHKVSHASVMHTITQAPLPSDEDLEAFGKVLRFAQEVVKGHSSLDSTQVSAQEVVKGQSSRDATQDSAQICMNEEEEICPACLGGYDLGNPKKLTSCGHHFHLSCIFSWKERSCFCPICQKNISIPK